MQIKAVLLMLIFVFFCVSSMNLCGETKVEGEYGKTQFHGDVAIFKSECRNDRADKPGTICYVG